MLTSTRIILMSSAFLCMLGLPPMPKAAATPRIPTDYIDRLYNEALERAPDSGGRDFWQAYYTKYGCSAATLRHQASVMYTSHEYSNKPYDNTKKVETLYRGLLDRDPDPTGWAYWTGELDAGATLADVINRFTGGDEFEDVAEATCL